MSSTTWTRPLPHLERSGRSWGWSRGERDHADLDICIFRQPLHRVSLTCREIAGKIFSINGVDLGEQAHIAEKERGLDDMFKGDPGRRKDRAQIVHRLVGLADDIVGFYFAR